MRNSDSRSENAPEAQGTSGVSSASPPVGPSGRSDFDPGLVNGRLQFLWNEYTRMVELFITVLTGTIVFSAGLAKLGTGDAVADRELFARGMAALLLALIAALLWRVLSQIFMEQEVFGSWARVEQYYSAEGIKHPFTTSYRYREYPLSLLFKIGSHLCMWLTAIGFISGLACLSYFTYRNLSGTHVLPTPASVSWKPNSEGGYNQRSTGRQPQTARLPPVSFQGVGREKGPDISPADY